MTFSLRKRFFMLTAMASIIVMLASSLILNYVYTQELKNETKDKLRLHIFNLLSVSNLENDQLALPIILSNPEFNREPSNAWAYVIDQDDQKIWQSLSLTEDLVINIEGQKTGEWQYGEFSHKQEEFLWASYGVSWSQNKQSYRYIIAVNRQTLDEVIFRFRAWLISGFIFVSVLFLIIQYWVLKLAFLPIQSLEYEITRLEKGKQDHITKRYPQELTGVSQNINALIKKEREQREKYRMSMANLAHSLKTPVAIIKNELSQHPHNKILSDALIRINETIEYQLRRAVISGPHRISQGVNIQDSINQILPALHKIHIDTDISVQQDIAQDAYFPGDNNDLLEVLGNLLDNSFKYAQSKICITANTTSSQLTMIIEDDGAGLLQEECIIIFNRGQRLDERPIGQGLGLSIVKDIIESYQGSIKAATSSIGGARFTITLPLRMNS